LLHCHCPRHCHLIAMLKKWVMATAAAMAALRAMVLGDCGGGSCNEDGSRGSGGKDDGDSGNSIGDEHPTNTTIHQHDNTPTRQYTHTTIHQHNNTSTQQYTNTTIHQHDNTPT
jgi:hypothetical protein